MAVHIRHKSALSVLALALTLYAGAKFCCPGGRGVPSSPEESGEGTRHPSSLVELLASLAWRYNVKMLGQGYQQVTFAEIGSSKMEMKNELKSILGTESWRHLVCPVVNISMK